ncbi:MAG: hypothetical protein EOO41_01710 [Methanobacteriota archaeon]|nr:MAG: hypothetical protein EOO41_01710 [Euryarchaeota archaeon]
MTPRIRCSQISHSGYAPFHPAATCCVLAASPRTQHLRAWCLVLTAWRVVRPCAILQIDAEMERVKSINARIGRAQGIIQGISGSNKATTILSRPKYPAIEVARFSTFSCLQDGQTYPILNNPLPSDIAPFNAQPLLHRDVMLDDAVLERPDKRAALAELYARVSLKSQVDSSSLAAAPKGLGKLPAYLPSISSTLVFNNKQNPYAEYHTLDDVITDEDERVATSILRKQATMSLVRAPAAHRGLLRIAPATHVMFARRAPHAARPPSPSCSTRKQCHWRKRRRGSWVWPPWRCTMAAACPTSRPWTLATNRECATCPTTPCPPT